MYNNKVKTNLNLLIRLTIVGRKAVGFLRANRNKGYTVREIAKIINEPQYLVFCSVHMIHCHLIEFKHYFDGNVYYLYKKHYDE